MKEEMELTRHGGPYDRGAADAYYQRAATPHYFKGDTYQSEKVEIADMTDKEKEQYALGFLGAIGCQILHEGTLI